MDGDDELRLRFRFTGQLLRVSDSQIEDSDRSLLGNMREQRGQLAREMQAYLQEELTEELGIEAAVFVEIEFQEGSILFTGFVTFLGYLATIAGAIDFVQKMSRLIRSVVRRVLGRRAPGRIVSIRVLPLFSVAATPSGPASHGDDISLFSLRTILLAVTLLNAAIFIGGSVYTGISVTSIQEKYEKAQTEIEKVRQDYEKYRAGLQDRLGDIEGQLRMTAKETEGARSHAKQLSDDLTSMDRQIKELESSVAALGSRGKSWVSVGLAYREADWVLRLYLIAVPICTLALLAAAFRLIWVWRS
jgi:hypothetical protein